MIEIDCLGDMCPVPILKLKDAIKTASANQTIKLITDHSCVLENIKDILQKSPYTFYFDEVITGVWEIFVEIN
ncbi:MAG: sulfurtransferase TusA family protein [Acetoanaerobium sp.]|jgi:tRNA 2-thiouridine synthesizing protein A|uniref:sulfurtransferase TusA family protein n=1 Tax=Acetoanaerobium sticklandii TaxID=1511 RepID=UPI001B5A127D|nr:sulfurtransferase TusA family protein [Acetoanaerobium sp.]MBP9499762.1 sulfurtransferase TusA family protein [Acetoanaerobium sp.]MBP9562059.1 sulfurtransferase TusA family protein [Acetoanaerobium sp.]MDK2803587.1 tRNA 2-thiouridine synthesizing protein [Peptostreptococcaceae bacterium]